jgi:hypothetical protein
MVPLHPDLPLSLADHLGGVVAAEGTFSAAVAGRRVDGTTRPTFGFAITLGSSDAVTAHLFHDVLGVGRIRRYPRRAEHYDDEVVFAVRAIPELVGVVVPFMDEHLRPSHKRTQYEAWRAELLAYDAVRARARSGSARQRPRPADR